MAIRIDISGERFGRLVVVEAAKYPKWRVRCDCGHETLVQLSALRAGKTKSCGCLNRERIQKHGMDATRTHWCWAAMIQRCENPNAQLYKHYGARGIKVCERWRSDFRNFLADMGEMPQGKSREWSLGRINNDGDYEPSNCRWETSKQQIRNRRVSPRVEYKGEMISRAELAERFGINHRHLATRLRAGYSVEEALQPSGALRKGAKRRGRERRDACSNS